MSQNNIECYRSGPSLTFGVLACRCAQYEESNRDLKDGLTDKEKECTKLEQLLQEAGKKLVWKHRLMAEVGDLHRYQ